MPKFISTQGRTKVAIAICGRCSRKIPYDELLSDPNFPGLMVCRDDLDVFDPWRLPAHPTEDISLAHPRPDVDISGTGAMPIFTDQISGISQYLPNLLWSPALTVAAGQLMTTQDPDDATVTLPIPQYLAITAGTTGASAAGFPGLKQPGARFIDGSVTWQVFGLYLM